jgi:type IV secretory pathway VirB10-like protein
MKNHPWERLEKAMLLSIVNMKLRDVYEDLNRLAEEEQIERDFIEEALAAIGYYYDGIHNQFKPQ